MKKINLTQLALLGITGGLMTLNHTSLDASGSEAKPSLDINKLLAEHKCGGPHGCPGSSNSKGSNSKSNPSGNNSKNSNSNPSNLLAEKDKSDGNMGYHLYTEDELLLELNNKGAKLYESLDSEGKALARLVASSRCNGTNECKGLNACQTEKNACAGKGNCKGQSKCAFSDKNLAVKAVADKLANKRAETGKKN